MKKLLLVVLFACLPMRVQAAEVWQALSDGSIVPVKRAVGGRYDVSFPDTDGSHAYVWDVTSNATSQRVVSLSLPNSALSLAFPASGTHSGTNTGDQTVTLTGDVTGSGTGSFAATIANDVIDFADMADSMTLDATTDVVVSVNRVLSVTNTGSGNSFVVNDEAADPTPFIVGPGGFVRIGNDLVIDGDDLFMATNTAGFILVADGTNFNPVAVSGDVSLSGVGAATIANDAVTYAKLQDVAATDRLLGRDTDGAGNVEELTASDGIEFTGAGIIATLGTTVDLASAEVTGDLPLTTRTSGDYVATIAAGTGIATTGAASGEGIAHSISATLGVSIATAEIDDDAVTYAKLQNISATSRFLGRITAAAGDAEELTGTQATSLLNAFVGDAGAGGTKGLVPAPAIGDAAKYLKGDGTWAIVSAGSGDITAVGSMTSGDAFAGAAADDDWLGLGVAAGRIEFDDQTVDEVNILDARMGVGDNSPDYVLEVSSAAASDSSFALSDADVAHGLTTLGETDAYAILRSISSTAGGLKLEAFSDTDAAALQVFGYIGSTNPTDAIPAVKIVGAKKLTTGVQDLGAAETVFSVANNDDAAAITVLGNGNVGFNIVTPDTKLSVKSFATGTGAFNILGENGSIFRVFNSYHNGIVSVLDADVVKIQFNTGGDSYFNTPGNLGIGSDTTPDAQLEVVNDGVGDSFIVADTNDGDATPFVITSDGKVRTGNSLTVKGVEAGVEFDDRGAASDLFIIYNNAGYLNFWEGVNRLVITQNTGNVGLGTSAFGTNAAQVLAIGNGTAPSTSPADSFQLYSADITAGNAAAHFRTEGGAVIKLYQDAANADTAGATLVELEAEVNQLKQQLRDHGFLAP